MATKYMTTKYQEFSKWHGESDLRDKFVRVFFDPECVSFLLDDTFTIDELEQIIQKAKEIRGS
jgi:hypothetical protein